MLSTVVLVAQLLFTLMMGMYFLGLMKEKSVTKEAVGKQSERELEKLNKLRQIKLTKPLTEKTRPTSFDEIMGQEQGIRALKAALCGTNPQHVIIYGPPGVGKTAAARLVLEEAKKSILSPFGAQARFIETDATTMRFDERNIADPLIGSVHDPIYQGAGAYGPAGIPQPKPGAVTKANGGILFIDEIGELHPIQMNKLLKVLEDRKVFLESAYYNSGDTNIPRHIRDIFDNGLPADFRLIGATTRSPEEIPAAIRSRCVEVFFKELNTEQLKQIVANAAEKGGFTLCSGVCDYIARYSQNGRDAVNMLQIAGSVAQVEGRMNVRAEDAQWVAESGKYSPRLQRAVSGKWEIGCVNGLAITGTSGGVLMEIEADISDGEGIELCGIAERETIETGNRKLSRMSTAKASVANAVLLLYKFFHIDIRRKHIHINIPGGFPVDGPSAGTAILCALYSAATGKAVDSRIAMTGEVSISGKINPVGGVAAKIEAAQNAGAETVYIPSENWQETFAHCSVRVVAVDSITDLLQEVFLPTRSTVEADTIMSASGGMLPS